MALRRARSSKDHPGIRRLFSDVVDIMACLLCTWALERVGDRKQQFDSIGISFFKSRLRDVI